MFLLFFKFIFLLILLLSRYHVNVMCRAFMMNDILCTEVTHSLTLHYFSTLRLKIDYKFARTRIYISKSTRALKIVVDLFWHSVHIFGVWIYIKIESDCVCIWCSVVFLVFSLVIMFVDMI